jgi:hypothetical protein
MIIKTGVFSLKTEDAPVFRNIFFIAVRAYGKIVGKLKIGNVGVYHGKSTF